MITIIDYGAGNLFSVQNALNFLGVENNISSKVEDIISADKLILPGVGAFPDAMKMLDEAGLKYQLKPVESEEDANTVTDQEPKSGEEVEEGTRVTIYYSQESSGITIPDVTNKSLEDATSQLESSNLTVKGTTEKYSDIVAKGKVCGTDPVVGSSVAKGTAVTLIISKGPENDMVRVPNLVKKSLRIWKRRGKSIICLQT